MHWLHPELLRLRSASRLLHAAGVLALLACGAEPNLTTPHERDEQPEQSLGGLNDADSAPEPAPNPRDAEVIPVEAAIPAPGSPEGVDAGTARADARDALVVPRLWLPVAPFADPFADGPEVPHCSTAALTAETLSDEPVFSVDTGGCDYVTVSQPIQRAVAAGETIKIRLWHFELSAEEPAVAHAAVLVDGLLALDERVPIPQPGGLIVRELRLLRAVPAGALAHFHLHNHGANSWSLVEVSAGPPGRP